MSFLSKIFKPVVRATSIGKTSLLPIAAGFLAPGFGSLLSGGLGLGLAAGGIGEAALGGLAAGGLSSGITGGNILKGALTGGVTGAIGNGIGQLSSGIGDTVSGSGTSSLTNNAASGLNTGGASSSFSDIGKGFTDNTDTLLGQNPSTGSYLSGSGLSAGDVSSPSLLSQAGDTLSSAYHGVADPISNLFGSNNLSAGGALPNASGGNSMLGSFGSNFKLGDVLGDVNSYFAQNRIADQQKAGFQQAQSYLSPFYQTGVNANKQLGDLLGTNGAAAGQSATDALLNNPDYQFRLSQGQKALDQNLNAQGYTGSGAQIKGSIDYNQGTASQAYQQAIANLMAQSGQGAQTGAALGNYASLGGQANAAATGQQSNIINQGLGSLFGSSQTPYSQLIQQLMGRSSFG